MAPMKLIPLPDPDPDLPLTVLVAYDVTGEACATLFACEVPVRLYRGFSPALVFPDDAFPEHLTRWRDVYAHLLFVLDAVTEDAAQAFIDYLGTEHEAMEFYLLLTRSNDAALDALDLQVQKILYEWDDPAWTQLPNPDDPRAQPQESLQ